MKQVALIAGVLYGPFDTNEECAEWAEAQPQGEGCDMLWYLDVHPPTKLVIPHENETIVRAWSMDMEIDLDNNDPKDYLKLLRK